MPGELTEAEVKEFSGLAPVWCAWGYWLHPTRRAHTGCEALTSMELQTLTDPFFRPLSSLYDERERAVFDAALFGRVKDGLESIHDEGFDVLRCKAGMDPANPRRYDNVWVIREFFARPGVMDALNGLLARHTDRNDALTFAAADAGMSKLAASMLVSAWIMRSLHRAVHPAAGNESDEARERFYADATAALAAFAKSYPDDEDATDSDNDNDDDENAGASESD